MTVENNARVRQPIDFRRDHDDPVGKPVTSARARPNTDAAAQRAYDRAGDSPAYSDFLRNVGESTERMHPEVDRSERAAEVRERKADAAVRARMDGFRDRFAGPYIVDGKSVSARPMFRMNGGFNDVKMKAREAELGAICRRAGCSDAYGAAKYGRPTPEQLVKVTQALIDAGKLPPGTDDSCELRIRQMQWEWGVGVDCAGYSEGAAAAARGKPTVQPSMGDAFSGLRNDRTKRMVSVAEIRSGDVIHLDPPQRNDVGHNVVVYDHKVLDSAKRDAFAARGAEAAAFFKSEGPFHEVVVDSSWGAGDGNDFGGFRRDTWIFDDSTKRWGYLEHGSGDFHTSARGPHDEPYTGAFRPRDAS